MFAHERNNAGFINAKLVLNRVEGGSIFPRHLHDTINYSQVQLDNLFFHLHIISDTSFLSAFVKLSVLFMSP